MFRLYPISTGWGDTQRCDHYAVQIGGSGGRILGRELNLDRERAELLCGLLRDAYEMGAESAVEG